MADERTLLTQLAATLARAGLHPDLSDDCATLRGPTDLVTTDTLVEGVHFDLALDTPEQVGAQAAVQNLSDLAGSGGRAGWLLWSLVLPTDRVELIQDLTAGFAAVAARHGAQVVGGNLSRSAGPLTLCVTAGGPLAGARTLHRAGAAVGEGVYLSGVVGDAALGLKHAELRALRHGWRPHLQEAARLAEWGCVGGAMDVSDGVAIDAARLAEASGLAIELEGPVPTSEAYRRHEPDDRLALSGGEDYVLLFTAAEPPPIEAWRIGRCVAGAGLLRGGAPFDPQGWDHFA